MNRQNCVIFLLLALAASAPWTAATAQPAAPTPAAPDYSSTSGVIPWSAIMENPLAGAANAGSASAAATGATDAVKGDGKPIHEELSRSNLQESIREFNAGDVGAKKPDDAEPTSAANPLRKPLTPAAKTAQEQANRAEWASASPYDRLMHDVLPWAWAVSCLLVIGLAAKLWLNYVRAKAARPGMRRRAARQRSHRSSRSAALAGDAADSAGDGSTLSGAIDGGNAGSKRSRRPSSAASATPSRSLATTPSSATDASGQQRQRSRRSPL